MKINIKKIIGVVCASSFVFFAQAAIVEFNLQGQAGSGLLPGNELGAVIGGGSGDEIGLGIQFDDVSKILTINVAWGSVNGFTDLSGNATASHLHGPASQTQNAGVLLNLASGLNTSATSGGITYTSTALSAANEGHLLAGNTYINVHTATNPGGEIRGNLVAIPEPSTFVLLAGMGAGLIVVRRKFRR